MAVNTFDQIGQEDIHSLWEDDDSSYLPRLLSTFSDTDYPASEENLVESTIEDDFASDAVHRGGFSGVSESWDDVQNLDSRILEVRHDSVKMEVLIDMTERHFEDRVFPRDLLEGAVQLQEGNYVLIRRFKGEGKIKFTFEDGSRIVKKEAFENTSRFQDLDDFDFDKEL